MGLADRDYMTQTKARPLQGTWDDQYGKTGPSNTDVRPPKRRIGRGLLVGAAVVAVALGIGVAGYLQNHPTTGSPAATTSVVPQTSETSFEHQVDQYAKQQGVTAIASTSCAFPKTWTVGESFACYVYGPANKSGFATSLGTVTIQVLTAQSGDAWNANFSWTAA